LIMDPSGKLTSSQQKIASEMIKNIFWVYVFHCYTTITIAATQQQQKMMLIKEFKKIAMNLELKLKRVCNSTQCLLEKGTAAYNKQINLMFIEECLHLND
jgi:hypothetical protein